MGFLEALRPYWHPVIHADAVQEKPVSVRLLDERVVLWRSGQEILAFQDLCVHRGAALSLGRVQGGNLECPYHGFQYAPNGLCVKIPSMSPEQPIPEKARVVKYRATERYDLIWVALEEPRYEIFAFPEYDDPEFHTFVIEPTDWNASAPRVIENNYDYTHVAFLHEGRIGMRAAAEVPPIPPGKPVGNELHQVFEGEEPNWAAVHQPGGKARSAFRYYNRLILPLCTHTRFHALDGEKEGHEAYLFVMAVSPTSEGESRVWLWVSRNYGWDIPNLEYERWEVDTLAQDKQVLESQLPVGIPTDPRKELFLANELHHVQYRRWLRSIGIE